MEGTIASTDMRSFLCICLGVVIGASSCAAPTPSGPAFVLGAAIPSSGKQAKAGGFFKQGYELAVQEANENGGVSIGDGERLPVRLVLYDDKSDAATTVSLVERLITVDQVNALLSGYSTPLVQAQVVVPEKYGVPYLNAGGASKPIFKPDNRWIFGLLTPVEKLAETTMDWLAHEQEQGRLPRPTKIALVWQNTDHGREYRAGVQSSLLEYPRRFELTLDESFEHLAKDHTALLIKVKVAGADVFLSDAHEPDYVLQHRAYVEQGLHHQVLSYGARGPEASVRQALGGHVDYVVSAQWWSPALPYPQSQAFLRKFTETYGQEPTEYYPALAYEAVRTLIAAVEDAGSLDREAIRASLASIDLEDRLIPGQRIRFSAENRFQIDNPCLIVQNKPGGRVDIIYPPDAATGEAVVPRPASTDR
jgi:branched-chain amino acid transport system substrate-binding protein